MKNIFFDLSKYYMSDEFWISKDVCGAERSENLTFQFTEI